MRSRQEITHGKGDQNDEPEQSCRGEYPDHSAAEPDVHEIEDDEGCLRNRDRQGHDEVEGAEIDVGDHDGEEEQDEKRKSHRVIGFSWKNMSGHGCT